MTLEQYNNEDYQNRGGNYPKSNKPVSIEAYKNELTFSFKNTNESDSIKAVKKTTTYKEISEKYKVTINAYQTGDFQDDWVDVVCKVS